jgi:glucose/arabinose dehydrogenase
MTERVAAIAGLVLAVTSVLAPPAALAADPPLDALRLPRGFRIAVYARDVDNARQMALGSKGVLFVGSRRAGKVYAVVDRDGDHVADRVHTIASGLAQPSGVAFREGALYVAAVDRVLRYDGIEAALEDPPKPVVVTDALPKDQHHGWKFIAFGPDGLLYVPVGAPCNVCARDDERYATIMRMRPDGGGLEVFARGIRNSVGFDWHPQTRVLWFTDNGRDGLGDDRPPDELNRAPRAGMHFGFPYCHGADLPDPEIGAGRSCKDFEPPARALGPHVAAIGMRFYTGSMFPEAYRNHIFIAEHGSWNRRDPIGYRVTLARVRDGKVESYEPFAEGWLQGVARRGAERGGSHVAIGKAFGRPADVLVMPDGALLVSDDEGGFIYRIAYEAPRYRSDGW